MNFLGHFLTSRRSDLLMAGSFLGDFLKGPVELHPEPYRQGLRLHRRVDRTGDLTPSFRAISRLLRPASGRYAPVVADIVCDHFLASRWERWSDESLDEFAGRAHRALDAHLEAMPPLPARVATRLISEQWLLSYATVDGLARSLARLERRIGRPLGGRAVLELVSRDADALEREVADMTRSILTEVERFLAADRSAR